MEEGIELTRIAAVLERLKIAVESLNPDPTQTIGDTGRHVGRREMVQYHCYRHILGGQ